MKRILFILGIFMGYLAHSQSFDNAIARYVTDSSFDIHTDSSGHEYVNIEPYRMNVRTTCIRLYFDVYNDYGSQPYQQYAATDSTPAVMGITKSANAFFNLWANGVSDRESISFTNINSNAYNGCHAFLSTKFLYWYFADKYGITID